MATEPEALTCAWCGAAVGEATLACSVCGTRRAGQRTEPPASEWMELRRLLKGLGLGLWAIVVLSAWGADILEKAIYFMDNEPNRSIVAALENGGVPAPAAWVMVMVGSTVALLVIVGVVQVWWSSCVTQGERPEEHARDGSDPAPESASVQPPQGQ
jgi:hypothetical protein